MSLSIPSRAVAASVAALLLLNAPIRAEENTQTRQSLEELRNTVVNILQALVAKGVITREQAEDLVRQAQEKAAGQVAANTAQKQTQSADEENAVRVPYVPQIVKEEIGKQVAADLQPQVVASVVKEAREKGWGVPGALPEWLSRVRAFGDITLREQLDQYAGDNQPFSILDFNAINSAGGIGRSVNPFLNTTENRRRLRVRGRLGLEADLSPRLSAGIRLATGSLTDPASETQTLGTSSARYTVGVDQVYLRWNSSPGKLVSGFSATGGRFSSPWFAPTELVFARDLQFEGVAATGRWRFGDPGPERSSLFATVGAFPMLEVPLVNKDNKWLLGGQLGANLYFSDARRHLTFGVAYYDFLKVNGRRNSPDSVLLNYTTPAFIRYGNSVFDISNNTTDPTVNLFALASKFRLIDAAISLDQKFNRYSVSLTGEVVRNAGYNKEEVAALVGVPVTTKENTGYVAEIGFGDPQVLKLWQWRARLGYRFVRRDAVIDSWTDTDFHGGGTNAAGYYLWTDLGIATNAWIRFRYLSANEIDGARYGLDVAQLDVNARF